MDFVGVDLHVEIELAEQWYSKTARPDLLGITEECVDDNRLYRALDQLQPHKEAQEDYLKYGLGERFQLEVELLLYDVTSTYFEGEANFPMAQRGYARDQRSDSNRCVLDLSSHDVGCRRKYNRCDNG